MSETNIIQLVEYSPVLLSRDKIPEAVGEMLWRNYGTQVSVDFPSPRTADKWKLTAKGWVGHIPITADFHFALCPKVPLENLLGMLEYAYNLKSFRFLDRLVNCQTIEGFYQRLAEVLASRILKRGRQGFYRDYLPKTEPLPYIRGRIDMRQIIAKPWQININCDYQEHSADLEDNQILAWTLWCITRSGLCQENVLPTVRRAYHLLQGLVTLQPKTSQDCLNRHYNRLNEDYRPLHALCRFFLDQSGPSHQMGERAMLPFLVNMAQLYQSFVAQWLKAHQETILLPLGLEIKSQQRLDICQSNDIYFHIDLFLKDIKTGTVKYLLDTKYKLTKHKPENQDIYQVIAYAVAMECQEAILLYPTPLTQPLHLQVGNIRVRSLTFSLHGNLEQAGYRFLQNLLETVKADC